MANLIPTTQSLLDPNAGDISNINDQKAFADALMQQGLQGQPQGQIISGYYVKPSITQALNPLAQALTGAYLGNKAENKAQQLASALRGKQAEAVQNYMQALNPQQSELAGPTPTGAPLQTVNTPDYNAAFQAATSPYAPAPLQAAGYEMIKPIKTAEGETVSRLNFNNGQYTPMAVGGEKLPNEVKAATAVLGLPNDPTKWTPQDRQAIESQMTGMKRAGANNINVSTGKSIAEQIGPMMTNSANQAVGAMKVNDAADQVLGALKSGNVITGPGANVRIPLTQISTMIGAGGSTDQEKLANTQNLVQNLAKLTLNGRQQMHGEGAISNSESNIAEKAMSGSANLTPTELYQLANAAKRSAAYQVQSHEQKVKIMESNPETAGLAPYFKVNSMTPGTPTGNNVVDYNSLK